MFHRLSSTAKRDRASASRRRRSAGRAVTPASWRFSPTVRSRKIRRCSGTRAIPARTSLAGSAPVTSRPASVTRPLTGRTNPATVFSNVVLPAPFGPTRATSSPSSTCNDTPCRATTAPYRAVTRSTRSTVYEPGTNAGWNASVKVGSPPSTVRITTSFCGTPLVPAYVTTPVVTSRSEMFEMVSIRVGPSSEQAVSAAWAKTLTTSEASAPKLTVSISSPASAAASRNAATPFSGRGERVGGEGDPVGHLAGAPHDGGVEAVGADDLDVRARRRPAAPAARRCSA